ncbi:hypothetical protein B0H11DRAFT_2105546 [Mycena galericulata]|nr:hypothetical protein B0H11DRAFT_2105546 [Mycena galericulata]
MFHFDDISEVSGPKSNQAPWVFTRVCRRWAEVALGTPALWSMVFLDLDRIGEAPGAIRLTNLLHDRSRNMPLAVKTLYEQGRIESHPVLDIALSHSERWKFAHIGVEFPLVLRLATIRSRLSTLTTLVISLNLDLEDIEVDPSFWDILEVSPKLTTACASFWEGDHLRPSPFVLPWHQLTRLSTTFTFNTEALSLLQKLPSIVECRLEYAKSKALPKHPSTIVNLPHLRFLLLQTEELFDSPDNASVSLLDCLETPVLESLTTFRTADEAAVSALLARSRCAESLTSFCFYFEPLRPDAMLALLQRTPRLSVLTIGDFHGTLLPTTMPTLITLLAGQWAAGRSPAQRTLSARFVDSQCPYDIWGELSEEEEEVNYTDTVPQSALQKDGLFVQVFRNMYYESLIGDDFDARYPLRTGNVY